MPKLPFEGPVHRFKILQKERGKGKKKKGKAEEKKAL